MDGYPEEIGDVLGQEMYTTGGTRIGVVTDVIIRLETEPMIEAFAVDDVNSRIVDVGSSGIRVPFNLVSDLDDVVLVSDVVSGAATGSGADDGQVFGG